MEHTESRAEFAKRVARGSASVALVAGLTVLPLWIFDAWLPFALPYRFVMKANTALCVSIASAALLLALSGRPLGPRLSRMLGTFVLAVSVLTIFEHASGFDLGIDLLLVSTAPGANPVRMAPATAAALACVGIALITYGDRTKRAIALSDAAILAACLLCLVVIVAYLYEPATLHGRTPLTRTSPQTALVLACIGSALALGRPDVGMMKLATGEGPGSLAIRWLLPSVVLVPIALGLIRLWAQRLGFLSFAEGLTFMVVSQIVILAGVAIAFARQTNRIRAEYERERERREEIERWVTMCAWTKQVKVGDQWVPMEQFLEERFGLQITHGMSDTAYRDETQRLQDLKAETRG